MQKIGLEAILEMTGFNTGMKAYKSSVADMEGVTDKAAGRFGMLGSALGTLGKVGIGAAIGGFTILTGVIAGSVKAAADAQKVEAQLDAVLRSTGGAAGMTKDQLLDMATALSEVTTFEDEVVISAETMLLQFKNIGKEVFPQATEMALDLAQRLGTDAAGAAQLLGKALESPGEGLLRLKQAGIAFTDEQEAMIKKMTEAGDAAGAQKYIMNELAKSVGGSARAAGETFSGQMEIVKNKIGNISESIGAAFLPVLTQLVDKFSQFVTANGPAIEAFFQNLANWLTVTLPAAIGAVVNFWTGKVQPILDTVVSWFSGEGQTAIGGFTNKITTFLAPAIEFAKQVFQQLIGWVQQNWPLIQQTVQTVMAAISTVISTVLGAIRAFWDEHGAAIMGVVNNVWTIIKTIITTVIGTIQGIIKAAMQMINGDWSAAWETIKGVLSGVWEAFKTIIVLGWDNIKRMLGVALSEFAKLWEKAWVGLREVAGKVWDTITGAVTGWVDKLVNAFKGVWDRLVSIGKSLIEGIREGIENAWEAFKDWLIGKIREALGALADFFGIGSPAKATMYIGEALAQGIMVGFAKTLAGGLNVPGISGGSWAMPAMGAAGAGAGTTNNSIGGDTIVLNINNRDAWAGAQSWIESRRRDRINVGM